jgi:N-acetylglucosamine kinase-like BadF-type ATPase
VGEVTPDLLVAVDGGNSKTDVVVVDGRLRVLGEVRGPGASPHAVGPEASLDAIEALIREALVKAGASPARVRRTAIYLAGIDFDRERDAMLALIARRGWAGDVLLDNDTFALLRAGTGDPGVAVVCGAGINCVGTDTRGRIVRFPSLGRISGDWGGGGGLAEEVMSAAARDEDGRGPATALTAAVTRTFGTATVLAAIEGLHFGDIAPERLHELSPQLFAAASDGDPVARALVERQADEVVAMAVAAVRGLALASSTVVLGGGILAAQHPLLVAAIAARIDATIPGSSIVYVAERPVAGAALLAVEADGIHVGPDDVASLREQLTAWPLAVPA